MTVRFQYHQNIGPRVRHWIFASFSPAGPAHDILNFRESAQYILYTMVHTIYFFERRFGWKHGLYEESTLIQLRHEVGTDEERQNKGWNRD
jgi:hypothetical protein